MKIGIESVPDHKSGYGVFGKEKYKKIRSHGYDCIDFDMADTNSHWYTEPFEDTAKAIAEERRLIEEAGLEISQIHGPWRWPPQDSTVEERAERMEKMKRSIVMTRLFGCKNWVIHPIMPYGLDEAGTESADKTWNLNVEFMSELLKTAKENAIIICFENMPMRNFSLAKPIDTLRFVKEMNDDNFKMCLDTGHTTVFGDMSVGNAVRAIGKDYLRVLHVHDSTGGMDLHLTPYCGDINWDEFAEALGEIGFDGVFSLETTPSKALDTDLFEDMCIMQAKMAKRLTEKAESFRLIQI